MSKTIEQVKEELNANIPGSAVSERDAGQGRKLSYLEGHYVINRLNQIFGPENWNKAIKLTKTFDGEVNGKPYTSYMAEVTLSVRFPDGSIKVTQDVGFGDGRDSNPGKTHELALKEASTDGLKRCAKDLGMSLGLALYNKSQENVDYAEPKKERAGFSKTTRDNGNLPHVETKDPAPVTGPTTPTKVGKPPGAKADIERSFKILVAKGTVTKDAFKQKYAFNSLADLNEAAIIDLYAKVKHDFPELQLS